MKICSCSLAGTEYCLNKCLNQDIYKSETTQQIVEEYSKNEFKFEGGIINENWSWETGVIKNIGNNRI